MPRFAAITLVAALTNLTGCDTQSRVFTYTTESLAGPITEVVIDLDSGTVQATGGGVGQVKSTAVAEWYGDKPHVEFTEEGSTLRVVAKCGRDDTCAVDLAFEMPPDARLVVSGATTDVMVDSLNGPALIRTTTGDIDLKSCSGTLDLTVSDGRIKGKETKSLQTTASTTNGAIELEYVTHVFSVVADTVRGDVSITLPPMSYAVEAKSGDGRVDVQIQQAPSSRRTLHAVASESGNITIKPGTSPDAPI